LKSSETIASEALAREDILQNNTEQLTELDSIVYNNSPEFESHLNIPFSHSYSSV
jgi:hypothetical protein